MYQMLDRLQELRVADCMNSQVVPISVYHTMGDAAGLLRSHSISGAPVVDEHGRCVGVLSAADFVRREADPRDASPPSAFAQSTREDENRGLPSLEIEEIFRDVVSKYMTTAVQTVQPDTPLLKAAQIMCGAHVHRLPVLDDDGRPAGMITSLDTTAVLVHLHGEAASQVQPRRSTR